MSLVNYLQETKAEMKHVSWPTKSQAIWFTVLVVIVSIATSITLGLFDAAYSYLLKFFLFQ